MRETRAGASRSRRPRQQPGSKWGPVLVQVGAGTGAMVGARTGRPAHPPLGALLPVAPSEPVVGALLPGPREVAEPREAALEAQVHRPDRTVALLADDDLGAGRGPAPSPPATAPSCRARGRPASLARGNIRRGRRTSPRPRPARSSPIRAGRTAAGRLSSRFSTWRESWLSATTGMFSSFAMAFSPCVISETSLTRFSLRPVPLRSWR